MPDGWRTKFCALLLMTDLTPSEAAKFIGINMIGINRYIKRTKDTELQNLINESRHAEYERKLENPNLLDIKSPKLIEMGIKHLTDWVQEEQNALPLAEQVIKQLKDARVQLSIDLQQKDAAEEIVIQQYPFLR